MRCWPGHTVIGHSGDRNENVARCGARHHGRMHVQRTLHCNPLDADRRVQGHRAGYQRHCRSRSPCRSSHRVAHAPGRQIGNAAHGIDGFKGGAGRQQYPSPSQCFRREEIHHAGKQFRWFQHPPRAHLATRLGAAGRPQHTHPIRHQLRHIALGSRVFPHLAIHGRCHQQRTIARQHHGCQQIIGHAGTDARQKISGRRCHQQQVGLPRQINVRHGIRHARIPLIEINRSPGKCLESRRRDEMRCPFAHRYLHFSPLPNQQAYQFCRLVGSYTTGDTEHEALAF